MGKKSVCVLLLALVFVSLFAVAGVSGEDDLSGQEEPQFHIDAAKRSASSGGLPQTDSPFSEGGSLIGFKFDHLKSWVAAWETGSDISTVFLKYLFLLLILALVYSAVSFIGFPEGKPLQIMFAVIISILATATINPNQLATITLSYTSLGLAFSLFLPVLILGFFTFVMAVKINVIGLVLQRILWAAYSVFLFVMSGSALLGGSFEGNAPDWLISVFRFLGGNVTLGLGNDRLIALILFVSSIIIFFTLVLYNDTFKRYLIAAARDAKIERYGDQVQKAAAARKAQAEDVDNA